MTSSYNEILFNANPYYDDFDSSKNHMKVLFRPGRAIQARELTQISTILQYQMEQFGSHIFEDGAVVVGGAISESSINFARVSTSTPLGATNRSALVGEKITDGNVTAEVYHVEAGSGLNSDPYEIVYFQYTTQGSFSAGASINTTGTDNAGISFSIVSSDTVGDLLPATGTDANLVTVADGVFFIDGYFVASSAQSLAVSNAVTGGTDGTSEFRNLSLPSASVGWSVSRSIVDDDDDVSLKDPSNGYANYNAPGADRYKVNLSLAQKEFSATLGDASGLTFDNSDYVELLRMVSGTTTKKVKYTDYANLDETFARRTYDESGNYTVNVPNIRVLNHGDVFEPSDNANKFAVGIEPNKSYVSGYEIDTQSTVYLPVDKAKEKTITNDETLVTNFGNSVLIDTDDMSFGAGVVGADSSAGFRVLTDQAKFDIANASGSTIGTCNVRTIKRGVNDGLLRAYLSDISMNSTNSFAEASKIIISDGVAAHTGATGTFFKIKVDSNGFTGPFGVGDKSLIFPLKNGALTERGVHERNQIESSFVVQKQVSIPIASGATTGSITQSYHDFLPVSNDNQYLVVYGITAGDSATAVGADLIDPSKYSITIDNGGTIKFITLDLLDDDYAALSGGASASVIVPMVYDSNNLSGVATTPYRTLALAESGSEFLNYNSTIVEGGESYYEYILKNSDVVSVTSVIPEDQGTSVPTDQYKVDTGNREGAIKRGRVLIKVANVTNVESNTVQFQYTYINHSGIGPVTVDSFIDSGIYEYEDIPSFTDPDSGVIFERRDCVDFRPVETQDSSTSLVTRREFGIPYNNPSRLSKVSYEHYLPRIDKVTLCGDSTYRIVKGSSSINPVPPTTTSYDMDMYHIRIDPYVFDINKDVKFKYLDNQRFTMKNIGEIEDRVDDSYNDNYVRNLYAEAIANSSQQQQSVIDFASNDGATKVRALREGVFVDDFSSHSFADTILRDHNCSVDVRYRGLRPPYTTTQVDLTGSSPAGISRSSDGIVTYKFTSTTTYQDLHADGTLISTSSELINPYGSTDYLGHLKINPSSSTYYDTSKNPAVVVNDFGENNIWENNVISYQDGRAYGWGSEHREYINHWLGEEDSSSKYGSVDPNSRSYDSPLNNSIQFRLPNRVLETIGDKTIDKSIVPYIKETDIAFEAKALLPGSTVYAIFDNIKVGEAGGYAVDGYGAVSGSVTIPNTFLTGIKQFRLTDSESNIVATTTTAAEANFYARGLVDNRSGYSTSVRPPINRRKSVNNTEVSTELKDQYLTDNFSDVVNGLEPLAQEIQVDSGAFPQGIFLDNIEVFFNKVDDSLPVMMQIRPIYNNAPHPNIVLPFSEVTLNPTTTSDGPNNNSGTTFQFSSPVYLSPGKYAICFLTNSTNNVIFKSVAGQTPLDTAGNTDTTKDPYVIDAGVGVKPTGLYYPLNNGSRVKKTNEVLTLKINRCKFDGNSGNDDARKVIYTSNLPTGGSAEAHMVNITCNEPLFTNSDIATTFTINDTFNDYAGIIPNKDVELKNKMLIFNTIQLTVNAQLSSSSNDQISPVLDEERISALAIKRESNEQGGISGGAMGELQPDAGSSTAVSRYVSKIVTIPNSFANSALVVLRGNFVPGTRAHVMIKTDDLSGNFDEKTYYQCHTLDANDDDDDFYIPTTSTENTSTDFFLLPKDGDSAILPEFSRYAVKVVIEVPDGSSESDVPDINDLRVIPLKIT
jgi:hypothetical protein